MLLNLHTNSLDVYFGLFFHFFIAVWIFLLQSDFLKNLTVDYL